MGREVGVGKVGQKPRVTEIGARVLPGIPNRKRSQLLSYGSVEADFVSEWN